MEVNWETCKENVQPLVYGRSAAQLDQLLAANKGSETYEERKKKRDEFEGLLRTDLPNPIDVWYEYITWIEKSYPEGGEEANLNKILESCISDLYNDERYKNNERFMEIFFKYMKIVTDHLEMFQMLYNSDTFVELALFYCNWSARLQEVSDYKKAEDVLNKGIAKMARPVKLLHSSLTRLKQLIEMEAENQPEQSDEENEEDARKALMSLKCAKKKSGKMMAPIERTKNYQEEKYRIGNQMTNTVAPNVKVTIFNDENSTASASNENGNSENGREVVNRIVINNQENDRKAGRWNEQKLKLKSQAPIAEGPGFSIFEDEDAKKKQAEEQENKPKVPVMDNALRAIKKHEKSPQLCLFEKLAPNQRFHSDLKKIYIGSTEFSFEEIRCRKLQAAKKRTEENQLQTKLKQELEEIKGKLVEKKMDVQLSAGTNLQEDVEFLKKQISSLLNEKTNQENQNLKPKSDAFGQVASLKMMKKLDLATNNENDVLQMKSPGISDGPKDLTIVQNLFNGSLEEEDEDGEHDVHDGKPQSAGFQDAKKEFTIYKDQTVFGEPNEAKAMPSNRHSLLPDTTINSVYQNFSDAQTIALPRNENDFIAMCSSTPAPFRAERMQSQKRHDDFDNCSINPFSGAPTGKLSPIVETSKEYKSSSSSSSSGFSSNFRFRTFHK